MNRDRDDSPALADLRGIDETVYQPAEDSGLLAEAAVEHAEGIVLDLGTGSGWVGEQVADRTDPRVVARVVASDVNPHACRQARERGLPAVRADLLSAFDEGVFDTVLFNPPYLPTDPEAEWDDWMEAALSGGETGRETIEPFLADLDRVLAPGGRALLLVSSLTGHDAVVDRAARAGFDQRTVREESYPFETLSVLLLTREETSASDQPNRRE